MKKKMKYIAGMLVVSMCTITSCSDDFLQTDSPNQPSQSTYWQTESDALMALTACYDAMQSDYLYDDNIDGTKDIPTFLAVAYGISNGRITLESGYIPSLPRTSSPSREFTR